MNRFDKVKKQNSYMNINLERMTRNGKPTSTTAGQKKQKSKPDTKAQPIKTKTAKTIQSESSSQSPTSRMMAQIKSIKTVKKPQKRDQGSVEITNIKPREKPATTQKIVPAASQTELK